MMLNWLDPMAFSGHLIRAFEVLSKHLRLIQDIPLKVSSVQPLDSGTVSFLGISTVCRCILTIVIKLFFHGIDIPFVYLVFLGMCQSIFFLYNNNKIWMWPDEKPTVRCNWKHIIYYADSTLRFFQLICVCRSRQIRYFVLGPETRNITTVLWRSLEGLSPLMNLYLNSQLGMCHIRFGPFIWNSTKCWIC